MYVLRSIQSADHFADEINRSDIGIQHKNGKTLCDAVRIVSYCDNYPVDAHSDR